MPDRRKHRGPGPQDHIWFGEESHAVLRSAVLDLSWLLTRGYAEPSALKLVGDRYQLVERQRTAVLRSSCSDTALADRRGRCVEPESLRGQSIRIDGFNLILTLETALGGGVVLVGRDGCYRDMASVHGTYRRVDETRPALELVSGWTNAHGIGSCHWFLDAPVSNSGRLAHMIRENDSNWTVDVVANPDLILREPGPVVVTADAGILDRSGAWTNLARTIINSNISSAFIVDLA